MKMDKVSVVIFMPQSHMTPVQLEGYVRFGSVEIDSILGVFTSLDDAQKRYGLRYSDVTYDSSRGSYHLCYDYQGRIYLVWEARLQSMVRQS